MREVCKKDLCTGCSLCAVSCAKKSISMQPMEGFGHLYPVINQASCIDCGLCQKMCPSLRHLPKRKPSLCYAAWAKDESEYKSSTSGGVAALLSRYVIEKGGVVYGCTMFPNIDVRHIRVDSFEGLSNLKGSKYVQSDISGVLSLIKKDIKEDRLVLFVGTPCQCGAVLSLFKQQPDNLYLVDLICHGVPSQKFLQQHVINKMGTLHVDKVLFRDGNNMALSVEVDGEIRYCKSLKFHRYEDLYFNTFFDGYSYRDSCYVCQYACPERAFDITIGDFWGLGKHTPATEIPDHPNGCSVILPLSDKGEDLIQAVSGTMNLYPREVDEAVRGNKQLQKPFPRDKRIRVFRWMVRHGVGKGVYRLIVADKILSRKISKIIKGK